FDVLAHERGEDGFALGYIFQLDREQCTALGVHGGLPELRRGHLAEAFVALDSEIFLALGKYMVEEFAGGGFLDFFLDGFLASGLCRFRFRIGGDAGASITLDRSLFAVRGTSPVSTCG